MEIEYSDSNLARLETEPSFTGGYSEAIVKTFRRKINFIRAAIDERDFRSMRSLNYEKLKGSRSHQHSMRLNDQFRLILEIKSLPSSKIVVVISIEDYH